MSVKFKGCNLAGGDSFYANWGASGPVAGVNYGFVTNADVDYQLSKGQNTFRLLFAWEAIQPTPYATLATLSGTYAIYRDRLYALVDYITGKGAVCILDIHGGDNTTFAAYRGIKVGSLTAAGQKVEDLLANVWRQLADKFKANPRVWFGITNEPQGIAPAVWFAAAQKVINSIRSTGATQPISMPGTAWTGAASWISSGNAAAWNLVDPANNLHVQLHLYCDADSSGTTTNIVSETIAVERLKAAVAWARGSGVRLFLGEVAVSASNPIAPATWRNLMAYVEGNSDVFLGWAWWGGGPSGSGWAKNIYSLVPAAGVDSPAMRMIQPSFAVLPEPVDPAIALQETIDGLRLSNATLTTSIANLRADVLSLKADVEESLESLAVERSGRLAAQAIVDAVRKAVA
jgi:endoglucanase